MRVNKNARQCLLSFQRVVAFFCVLLLFSFIGIATLFTSTIYASGAKSIQAASTAAVPVDTGTPTNTPTSSPTDTPTPLPTDTPIPPPTNTPIPPPTNTPVPPPTNTPIPPPTNTPDPRPPTTPLTPTSTSAAVAPVGTPPGAPSRPTTPGPITPSAQATGSTGGAVLPPTLTGTTMSPTAITQDHSTAQDAAGKNSLSTSAVLVVGALGLIATALLAGFAWRRRQESHAQQKKQSQQVVAPVYSAVPNNDFVTNYAQYVQNASSVVEPPASPDDKPPAQENGVYEEPARVPDTPIPPPGMVNNAVDPFLEAMMRQAQMGLFAVPGKEENRLHSESY